MLSNKNRVTKNIYIQDDEIIQDKLSSFRDYYHDDLISNSEKKLTQTGLRIYDSLQASSQIWKYIDRLADQILTQSFIDHNINFKAVLSPYSTFDFKKNYLNINKNNIKLSKHISHVLRTLILNSSQVCTREILKLNNSSDRSIDVIIVRLKKIIETKQDIFLKVRTIRHRGFILDCPVNFIFNIKDGSSSVKEYTPRKTS
jgi:DNA-binding winged helix-turn-helix (wHTH) protein